MEGVQISKDLEIINKINAIFEESKDIEDISDIGLSDIQLANIETMVENEENQKAVFTVLVSSLFYKCLHPEQDVRRHQAGMENGYSGRTFDTQYVTPFLKLNNFAGHMAETGWSTKSLEHAMPYDMNYSGKIKNKKVRNAFKEILHDVEVNNANHELILKALLKSSYDENQNRNMQLLNPINSESKHSIEDIINILGQHFYYYQNRNKNREGAALLPVIAIYSMYELEMEQISRFSDKKLCNLSSHTSADIHTNNAGDIDILDENGDLYEVVEVKFDKYVDYMMVWDCFQKIKPTTIQRYYILSTLPIKGSDKDRIKKLIKTAEQEHGCQIIINGVFQTIRRLLRIVEDPDMILNRYWLNIQSNPEVKFRHKQSWNNIMEEINSDEGSNV